MLETPDTFIPLLNHQHDSERLLFVFREGNLLVRESDFSLPGSDGNFQHELPTEECHPVGRWQGRYCCATTWTNAWPVPADFAFVGMRTLLGSVDEQLLGVAGRAFQIAEWARTHKYCGVCAAPMELANGERAYRCPACGMIAYPRISPAMMVLIKKGSSILLARHVVSPSGRFSPLAGFLEAGESIEQAIHREVFEEVGLEVGNINYFGSQSWPFPHSLMIAFTAEHVGGEIVVDQREIAEARWFGPQDELLNPYPEVSISGMLVNAHRPLAVRPQP